MPQPDKTQPFVKTYKRTRKTTSQQLQFTYVTSSDMVDILR